MRHATTASNDIGTDVQNDFGELVTVVETDRDCSTSIVRNVPQTVWTIRTTEVVWTVSPMTAVVYKAYVRKTEC